MRLKISVPASWSGASKSNRLFATCMLPLIKKNNQNSSTVWVILLTDVQMQKQQACAAEIAVLYAALACKQNKRYRTSARLTKTRDRCSKVSNKGTGRTDRRTDRVRRNMRPPPTEEGHIIILSGRNNRHSTMCVRPAAEEVDVMWIGSIHARYSKRIGLP